MTESQQSVEGQGSESGGGGEFKPITSQDDFNKALGARLAAERKKVESQFADYDQVKARADELEALAAGSKSQTDLLTERLTALETAKAESDLSALRFKVAQAEGVDAADMDLLVGTDPDTLTRNAKRITSLYATAKKNGNHVPREGTGGGTPAGTPREQFAALMRGQLNTE